MILVILLFVLTIGFGLYAWWDIEKQIKNNIDKMDF